jgi:hypothetical protein
VGEFSSSGSLPRHYYVWVDSAFIREDGIGFEPAVWFGLHSHPGRAWGCHVLLECGAFYRNLPPHAIAFSPTPTCTSWTLPQAQIWDCYGTNFSLLIYDYLDALQVRLKGSDEAGEYLFTAVPQGDAYTHDPSQGKEFMFIRTVRDRLAIVPTNNLLFEEKSFTVDMGWPQLKRSSEVWTCE